jgi:hypothetical protein
MRCKQLEHTSSWVLEGVYFVFENAYFVRNISPPISSRTRSVCQQRFNSILGELASLCGKRKTNGGGKGQHDQRKKFGYSEDGRLWISYIMSRAKVLVFPSYLLRA